MPTLNRESIEQEIGKRFEKIEKTLERTLEKTLKVALTKAQEIAESPAGTRAQAAAEKAQEKIMTARKSLDGVLLGLEHRGYNVKEPQDLIQTVGRRILARASEIAEDVRSQVAMTPYSPEWLKNVSIPKTTPNSIPNSITDIASAPDMGLSAQPSAGFANRSATEADTVGVQKAAPHGDADIASASLAEASKSDRAANFRDVTHVTPKKVSKVTKTKK